MIKRTKRRNCAGGILLGLTALSTCVALGGDLEPPGPPAPTMKTLAEVEPRIPIHAADLPLTITTSGSYYLTENMSATGDGILISTSVTGVTIDLMGFTLSGGTGIGISAGSPSREIVVRNGTVTDWGGGGVILQSSNSMVIDVTARANTTSYGIRVGAHSRVLRSTAIGNFHGFLIGDSSLIRDCIAALNERDGISAASGSYVLGNLANGNGTEGNLFSAGIAINNIFWTDVRVEGNTVIGNPKGIYVVNSGNLIIKNSASGNTTDYDIVAGNDVGPVGDAVTSTSPWANIQF